MHGRDLNRVVVVKKVGTLSFHTAYNFGAVLQALGLLRTLRILGVDAEIIDYRSPVHYARKLVTRRPLRWLNTRVVDHRFRVFRQQDLTTSEPCYDLRSLERLVTRYDAVIVGSDQVWNLHKAFEPALFLDFNVPDSCKRVSYAACFGRDDQPPGACARVLPALNRFDSISVRNLTSQRVLAREFNIDAPITADPTLLADYSDLAAPPVVGDDYTFLFAVDYRVFSKLKELVSMHKSITNIPIVMSRLTWSVPGVDRRVLGVGPRQWLSLILHSRFIITDSFHGMVFAIKYCKPFVAIYTAENGARMHDLLDSCGIGNRVREHPSEEWFQEMLHTAPDWDEVHGKLKPLLESSRQYLRNALDID